MPVVITPRMNVPLNLPLQASARFQDMGSGYFMKVTLAPPAKLRLPIRPPDIGVEPQKKKGRPCGRPRFFEGSGPSLSLRAFVAFAGPPDLLTLRAAPHYS